MAGPDALPASLLAIPVIFAPEIRRTLERLGRAGTVWPVTMKSADATLEQTIRAVVSAARGCRLVNMAP